MNDYAGTSLTLSGRRHAWLTCCDITQLPAECLPFSRRRQLHLVNRPTRQFSLFVLACPVTAACCGFRPVPTIQCENKTRQLLTWPSSVAQFVSHIRLTVDCGGASLSIYSFWSSPANISILIIFSWPATMWGPAIVMIRVVRPSVRLSVCLSHANVSETKRDRPITMKYDVRIYLCE